MNRTVHVIAGPALRDLETVSAHHLAALIDTELTPIPAPWVSSRAGRYNHGFLLENQSDNRVSVFAESLLRDYSQVSKPLLVIPLDNVDGMDDGVTVPEVSTQSLEWVSVLSGIYRTAKVNGVELTFSVSVPSFDILPDYARQTQCVEKLIEGMQAEDMPVGYHGLNQLAFSDAGNQPTLAHALRAKVLLVKVIARCEENGIDVINVGKLSAFCSRKLEIWADAGLAPKSMNDKAYDTLADRILEQFWNI